MSMRRSRKKFSFKTARRAIGADRGLARHVCRDLNFRLLEDVIGFSAELPALAGTTPAIGAGYRLPYPP